MESVAKMQPEITEQYQRLVELAAERKGILSEVLEFHEFVREADLVELWIKDKVRSCCKERLDIIL